MAETAERDRYLFGALESSAQNRAKVLETNYGIEEPEGVFLTSLDYAVNWISRDLARKFSGHRPANPI
jgi:NADH-quinone oxidoreductase subunit B